MQNFDRNNFQLSKLSFNFQELFPISDETILNELLPWKEKYDTVSHRKIIDLNFTLDSSDCYTSECIMGDFLSDVFLKSSLDKYESTRNDILKEFVTPKVSISFVQAGGIRTTLPKGCKIQQKLFNCIEIFYLKIRIHQKFPFEAFEFDGNVEEIRIISQVMTHD